MIIFYTGRCYTYFCSWLGSDKRCQQEATGPYDVCFRFGCPCMLSDFATKLSTQRNKTKCIFLSRWRNKEVWYTFLAPLRRLWAVSLLNTSLTYCRSISYHSTSLTDANSKPEGGIWETTSRCEESCHRNEYSRDQVTAINVSVLWNRWHYLHAVIYSPLKPALSFTSASGRRSTIHVNGQAKIVADFVYI